MRSPIADFNPMSMKATPKKGSLPPAPTFPVQQAQYESSQKTKSIMKQSATRNQEPIEYVKIKNKSDKSRKPQKAVKFIKSCMRATPHTVDGKSNDGLQIQIEDSLEMQKQQDIIKKKAGSVQIVAQVVIPLSELLAGNEVQQLEQNSNIPTVISIENEKSHQNNLGIKGIPISELDNSKD